MRWVALLLFGAFGAILLVLANNTYRGISAGLARMNAADGVIASIDEPRNVVAVKYKVPIESAETPAGAPAPRREEEREFYTTRPSKATRVGDKIRILYNPARPDAPQPDVWTAIYQEALVLGGAGLVAIFLALGAFFTVGTDTTPATAEEPVMVLSEPIELHRERSQLVWLVVLALAGMGAMVYLASNPGILWTRFLAYPAVFVGVIICLVVLASVYDGWTERLRVTQDGVERSSAWKITTRVAWSDVAKVKSVRSTGTEYSSGRSRKTFHPPHIVLFDDSGRELLDLSTAGWDPPDNLRKLVAYIPKRTGLNVVEEIR